MTTPHDKTWWQCAHTDFGMRCSRPATITTSTLNMGAHGKGEMGPWFCSQHSALFDPSTYRPLPPASPPQTAHNLTPQQWYNVCKFFPTIAARCQRPPLPISTDSPFEPTASLGLLLPHTSRPHNDGSLIE